MNWFADRGDPLPASASFDAPWHLVETAFPQLGKRRTFHVQVTQDLEQRGLAKIIELNSVAKDPRGGEKVVTDLGDEFLWFIAAAP